MTKAPILQQKGKLIAKAGSVRNFGMQGKEEDYDPICILGSLYGLGFRS